jgi:hypothetical protein
MRLTFGLPSNVPRLMSVRSAWLRARTPLLSCQALFFRATYYISLSYEASRSRPSRVINISCGRPPRYALTYRAGYCISLSYEASRSRPVSGHRQVMESVENERPVAALRAHISSRVLYKSIIRGLPDRCEKNGCRRSEPSGFGNGPHIYDNGLQFFIG